MIAAAECGSYSRPACTTNEPRALYRSASRESSRTPRSRLNINSNTVRTRWRCTLTPSPGCRVLLIDDVLATGGMGSRRPGPVDRATSLPRAFVLELSFLAGSAGSTGELQHHLPTTERERSLDRRQDEALVDVPRASARRSICPSR